MSRLQVVHQTQHKDACTTLAWALSGELFTGSDDSTVHRWNHNGEPISKVCEIDSYLTDLKWFPVVAGQKAAGASDMFVAGCSDGVFRIINAVTCRVEKAVEAHKGAVVCLAWNWDGTALATGGEEGLIKIWSQSGAMRSTLANTEGMCIHSLAWSPDSDQILYTAGKEIVIKPLQPSAKQLKWRAHEGVILKVDWSPVTNLIVSGGEDGRYKVWDSYGRQLYASSAFDQPVTCVAFSPDGETFAVGGFNILRVCDKTGWSRCRESTNTGSIISLAWTADCTQLACGGSTGAVCFAQLVDRRFDYKNLSIRQGEANRIQIRDVISDHIEELDQRDKIIKVSVGYGYLVVATTTQCIIYDVQNFSSPTTFDVKDVVNLVCQTDKMMLLMDHRSGLQVFQYDGKHVCNLKLSGVRTEFLNYQSVSLSPDTVAIRDAFNPKCIRVFEALTGKESKTNITHEMEIVEIALSQYGPQAERKVALIDRNRDLYLCNLGDKPQIHKLATMVASMKWNDYSEVLIAVTDGRLAAWYYPGVVLIDRDLLPRTKYVHEDADLGRHDVIVDFFGSRCTIRRGTDGAILTHGILPYPSKLFDHIAASQWDAALRLCRFVKEDSLWSVLAALAVKHGNLDVAEKAYAAIDEVDKLQYIKYIAEIPTPEGRNAELALFQRRPQDAESILLQAGLFYRAIRLHIRLFNFERALDLAIQHKTHIDTVVAFRKRYLEAFGREETSDKFLSSTVAGLEWNWDDVNAKIEKERTDEAQRGGGGAFRQ